MARMGRSRTSIVDRFFNASFAKSIAYIAAFERHDARDRAARRDPSPGARHAATGRARASVAQRRARIRQTTDVRATMAGRWTIEARA